MLQKREKNLISEIIGIPGSLNKTIQNNIALTRNMIDKSVIIKGSPHDIESYNNMGIAFGQAKQYDKAIEVFEKATVTYE